MSAPAADNLSVLPESVLVTFRKHVAGLPSDTPYTVTVTLAGLELDDYRKEDSTYLAGFTGTKVFHSSANAIYTTSASVTPSNASSLGVLATQIATDYYLWQQARLDLSLVGYPEWVLTGMEEEAEFVHEIDEESGLGRLYTHLTRGPWLEPEGAMGHYDPDGPDPPVEPGRRVIIYPCSSLAVPGCNEMCRDGSQLLLWDCEANDGAGGWLYWCQCFPEFSGNTGSGTPVCLCEACEGGAPPRWKFTVTIVTPDETSDFADAIGEWTLEWDEECVWTATMGDVTATLSYDDTVPGDWLLRFENDLTGNYNNFRLWRSPFLCCGENEFIVYAPWDMTDPDGWVAEVLHLYPDGPCDPCDDEEEGDISSPCCSSTLLPEVLEATFSNGSGSCICVNGTSVTLTHNGTAWVGDYELCGTAGTSTLTFQCVPLAGWQLANAGTCDWGATSRLSSDCSPLEVVFRLTIHETVCCQPGTGTFDITVSTPP